MAQPTYKASRATKTMVANAKNQEREMKSQHLFVHELVYGEAAPLLPPMVGRFTRR